MTSAPAIGFEYRASRLAALVLTAVTALACLAVGQSGMPLVLKVLAALIAMVMWLAALWRLRLPIHAVGWASHGGWSLHGRDGIDEAATLLSFRAMHRVVLLRLASQRYGTTTLWLMPDNSDADIRRRLRMRLAVQRQRGEEDRR